MSIVDHSYDDMEEHFNFENDLTEMEQNSSLIGQDCKILSILVVFICLLLINLILKDVSSNFSMICKLGSCARSQGLTLSLN